MRVVIADDSMLTREGIAHVLNEAGIEVAAKVATADALLLAVDEVGPDVALVDIRMPPTHTDEGLVAARRIRAARPEVGVLVLSSFVESEYAVTLLEEHPERSGYLLKERVHDPAVLVDVLRRIDDGETVVDPTIVARLVNRRRRVDPLAVLTDREREVLSAVAEGLSNRAIAQRIHAAERTIESHVTQIFLKLGLDEVSDANRRVLAVLVYLRTQSPTS